MGEFRWLRSLYPSGTSPGREFRLRWRRIVSFCQSFRQTLQSQGPRIAGKPREIVRKLSAPFFGLFPVVTEIRRQSALKWRYLTISIILRRVLLEIPMSDITPQPQSAWSVHFFHDQHARMPKSIGILDDIINKAVSDTRVSPRFLDCLIIRRIFYVCGW